MSVTLKRVGNEGERHGEHGSPAAADEQEWDELHILVLEQRNKGEADAAEDETHGVGELGVLELRKHYCPQHAAHSLNGKEYSHPVAGLLECLRSLVGGVPARLGNRTGGVGPHIEEACPAEELHESDLPECRGGVAQEREPVGLVLLVVLLQSVIFGIFLRGHFLNLCGGVDYAEDEYRRTDVERVDYRVGYDTFRGYVADTDEGEEEREHEAYDRACVAEETLDGVCERLLLLVHCVAHKHLERLHGHIDARVEEHQGYQSEYHGCADGHAERAGIRQQAHYEYGYGCAYKKIGDASAEAAPRLVGQGADDWLHDDSHQWRENPEITEVVRVCAECGEDARDVCALEGVCDLYAEEAKTEIPQLPKT